MHVYECMGASVYNVCVCVYVCMCVCVGGCGYVHVTLILTRIYCLAHV